MKKSFYELYLANKNEVSIDTKEVPKIRSPNKFYLRISYFIKQFITIIIAIIILGLSVIGMFAITNIYIRNEMIKLLF